jgi:hypothetical protein
MQVLSAFITRESGNSLFANSTDPSSSSFPEEQQMNLDYGE